MNEPANDAMPQVTADNIAAIQKSVLDRSLQSVSQIAMNLKVSLETQINQQLTAFHQIIAHQSEELMHLRVFEFHCRNGSITPENSVELLNNIDTFRKEGMEKAKASAAGAMHRLEAMTKSLIAGATEDAPKETN